MQSPVESLKLVLRGRYGVQERHLLSAVRMIVDGANPDPIVALLDQIEEAAGLETHCTVLLAEAEQAVAEAEATRNNALGNLSESRMTLERLLERFLPQGESRVASPVH